MQGGIQGSISVMQKASCFLLMYNAPQSPQRVKVCVRMICVTGMGQSTPVVQMTMALCDKTTSDMLNKLCLCCHLYGTVKFFGI